MDIFVGSYHVYTVHAPAWLGNPLHILELGEACHAGTPAEPPEAVLKQLAQRARDLGLTRSHNSLARVSHHFSAARASEPSEPSVHSSEKTHSLMRKASTAAAVDWGVRGCTARASRGCRVWKVPRWVLEIIAAEDPKFAPTLAQCIVDSFDRDVKDMPTKRLDHASMPEQEAAKEQVPNENGDPADSPEAGNDLSDSESSVDRPVNGVHDQV